MNKIKNILKKIWIFIKKNLNSTLSIIWSLCSIFSLWFVFFPLSTKLDNIQLKLNQQQAQSTMMSYFTYIENWNYEKAYNLFSDEKKKNNQYELFANRLEWFVAFEWLKITELTEKNSAIQKVYLAEFWFKKRGRLSIPTKRWFYVRYNWETDKWEINYSNVLYNENWWDKWACNFYHFEHCK